MDCKYFAQCKNQANAFMILKVHVPDKSSNAMYFEELIVCEYCKVDMIKRYGHNRVEVVENFIGEPFIAIEDWLAARDIILG
jgi:hypothetical protein